jgi:hypothetical protein
MTMFGHSGEVNGGDEEFKQKSSAWFVNFLPLGSRAHIMITGPVVQYLLEKSIIYRNELPRGDFKHL